MMQLNHSQHFLQKMAQNVADISANEKKSGRGGLQRVGKGGQCRQQHQYLNKDKKLTNLSHIILGEPPLLQDESRRDYENLLSDTIEFCGGERPTELIAAHDIARETWQIHRLLKMREQTLQSAYSSAIDRMRQRPNQVAKFAESHNEATASPPDCGDDDPMDPGIILAEALHERFGRLKDIEGQIDRKRRRRRQTIHRALVRRGSRLRLTLAAPQDLKPIN
jgi:hypothetical protein